MRAKAGLAHLGKKSSPSACKN